MSATVSDVAPSEFINGSDMLYALQSVQGQLWERVAEGEEVRPLVRAESNLGPLAYLYPDAYSGIIRAGERIK